MHEIMLQMKLKINFFTTIFTNLAQLLGLPTDYDKAIKGSRCVNAQPPFEVEVGWWVVW